MLRFVPASVISVLEYSDMIWNVCFAGSVIVLLAAVMYALTAARRYKSGQILTPFHTIFAGMFLAVYISLIPVFAAELEGESGFLLKLGLFDALQTIQVFTVNVGGDFILENINTGATTISEAYSAYMTCLFFAAPLLTFGFLVSLFKNTLENLSYRIHFWGDVYVFSELNEKALLLAQSLRSNHRDAQIVFTNVDKDEGDITSEYIESAKELSALIFQKDIVSVDFSAHSAKGDITFFVISEKEGDNLIQSLKLLSRYNTRENTQLYVFSTGTEGELLLSNADKGKIKLRRVNEVRSKVYRYLYDNGSELFESAYTEAGGEKQINVAIVGLGKTGTEILKALPWYCQMDGYNLTIHAFDREENAEDRFSALCPELMSPKYNGVCIPGETQYTIHIHSGVDVATKTFADRLMAMGQHTFVFVCLGDDEDNINCAANIRMLCERCATHPVIRTVVQSTEESEALIGICNYRGQPYGISPFGNLESSYSEEVLMGSELEKLALERHLKWGQEEEFWQYEYNYRSSMASAIHMKARIACAVPGADKEESQISETERDIIEKLEHRRWNAYMRSDGYIYSGSPDKSSRNDLAKMHHNLVDFDVLTEEDKRKDSAIATF